MIGTLNRSTWLTHLGVASAVVGIGLATRQAVAAALICLVISGLCDLADGPIARALPRSPEHQQFGVMLDTVADVVSFIALPVTITTTLMGLRWWPLLAVVTFGYTVAALTRLAAFSAAASAEGPGSHYRGLPVTYAALVLPTGAVITALAAPMGGTVFAAVWVVLLAVLAVAFVIDRPVAKPRGLAYPLFGLVAVVLLVALTGISLGWAGFGGGR